MKLLAITPMLWTRELNETVEFYTKTLGFACGEKNDEWGWAIMHRGAIEVMIAIPNEHTPFEKPMFTGSFYITTDDVNELWDELKDKTKVLYPIDNFEYGMREFAILDNNGYTLQFGQELKV